LYSLLAVLVKLLCGDGSKIVFLLFTKHFKIGYICKIVFNVSIVEIGTIETILLLKLFKFQWVKGSMVSFFGSIGQ
jgi:hypothetical protein